MIFRCPPSGRLDRRIEGERTVGSHVQSLRRKLGVDGVHIVQTVLGVGYRLSWAADA